MPGCPSQRDYQADDFKADDKIKNNSRNKRFIYRQKEDKTVN